MITTSEAVNTLLEGTPESTRTILLNSFGRLEEEYKREVQGFAEDARDAASYGDMKEVERLKLQARGYQIARQVLERLRAGL